MRKISEIANEIKELWISQTPEIISELNPIEDTRYVPVVLLHSEAIPYLNIMLKLHTLDDMYKNYTAELIITNFIYNTKNVRNAEFKKLRNELKTGINIKTKNTKKIKTLNVLADKHFNILQNIIIDAENLLDKYNDICNDVTGGVQKIVDKYNYTINNMKETTAKLIILHDELNTRSLK